MNRIVLLQGKVKFLIGGKCAAVAHKSASAFALTWFESKTDGYSPDGRGKGNAFVSFYRHSPAFFAPPGEIQVDFFILVRQK